MAEPTTVDVAVCGGGVVGLTAALQIADAGVSVAVLERDRIAAGVTDHSTATLTAQHGLKYDILRSKHEPETARQYAAANRAAIEHVASRVEQWNVDCDFERRPAIMYPEQSGRHSELRAEREVREHFEIQEVVYRWSTQDYASVDGIPYVGHGGPLAEDLYIATGFGGWRMSNGVAGLQLADMVRGRETPWQRAFDPRRVTVQESVKKLVTESANEGGQFLRGWMKHARADPTELKPDEAAVYGRDGKPVAAYRDPDGELHTRSAVCPHMGCVVQFNPAERSWDCPCHGSRFGADGAVFDGPAIEGLSSLEAANGASIEDDERE